MTDDELGAAEERARVGLCADCACAQRIITSRGATFYRCRRSETDPGYPRYPALPVVTCVGHVRAADDGR